MRTLLLLLSLPVLLLACKDRQKVTTENGPMVKTAAAGESKPMQSEFADAKYTERGKQMMQDFASGNIDRWIGNFSDNAVFQWSSGDSLAGKNAISNYWKNRRMNVINTIRFSNDIWLPIKVNTPQRGPDMPGVWLLNWYQVNVQYKNGKALQFWTHNDYHFNSDDKIDRAVQYIDRAPINAATGLK
jgi:hypothetical protein